MKLHAENGQGFAAGVVLAGPIVEYAGKFQIAGGNALVGAMHQIFRRERHGLPERVCKIRNRRITRGGIRLQCTHQDSHEAFRAAWQRVTDRLSLHNAASNVIGIFRHRQSPRRPTQHVDRSQGQVALVG